MVLPKKMPKVQTVLSVTTIAFICGMLIYSPLQNIQKKLYTFHKTFIPPLAINKKNSSVLFWTPFFQDFDFPESTSGLGCLYDNCTFTHDRAALKTSDAIILHWRDINVHDLPPMDTKAKLILYNYEAPPNVQWESLEPVISRINYVATYRLDSDITCPYGSFRQREPSDGDPVSITLKEFHNKKGIVNVVSHCNTVSKREKLIENLRNFIPVTVFGKCGSRSECQESSQSKCYQRISKSYKFYLSYENSFCTDYATEKVFFPLVYGMVPVVFGAANYSHILPPNSYINSLDFRTSKDLADYLHLVDTNFTLYKSYHKWRENFVIVHATPAYYWLCDVCRKLHEYNFEIPTKTKEGFQKWWYDEAQCSEYLPEYHRVMLRGR